MSLLRSLSRLLAISALSLVATGCSSPLGMFGHRPAEVWRMTPGPVAVSIDAKPGRTPIVMKRFESRASNPVGAHFRGDEPASRSVWQGYGADFDLSLPLFRATFSALLSAGYPVWSDYNPSADQLQGPPKTGSFRVVRATVERLEIHTFDVSGRIDEGAAASLSFVVLDGDGKKMSEFSFDVAARIERGKGDVLIALGHRIAARVAQELQTL